MNGPLVLAIIAAIVVLLLLSFTMKGLTEDLVVFGIIRRVREAFDKIFNREEVSKTLDTIKADAEKIGSAIKDDVKTMIDDVKNFVNGNGTVDKIKETATQVISKLKQDPALVARVQEEAAKIVTKLQSL